MFTFTNQKACNDNKKGVFKSVTKTFIFNITKEPYNATEENEGATGTYRPQIKFQHLNNKRRIYYAEYNISRGRLFYFTY